VVGYGRAIVPYKCLMVFPCITDVWTATSLSTLKSTKGLNSWCCVWVEEEGIQIVEQVMGKSLDDVLRHWLEPSNSPWWNT
jgi:hypothetical protein